MPYIPTSIWRGARAGMFLCPLYLKNQLLTYYFLTPWEIIYFLSRRRILFRQGGIGNPFLCLQEFSCSSCFVLSACCGQPTTMRRTFCYASMRASSASAMSWRKLRPSPNSTSSSMTTMWTWPYRIHQCRRQQRLRHPRRTFCGDGCQLRRARQENHSLHRHSFAGS